MNETTLTPEILAALGAPFGPDEIDFLPRAPSNGKALALAYIDARLVMARLDKVVGGAWSFDYDVVAPKQVKGRLTVCGVTRCDAGEADKEDEPLKSAVSDALKRAAVHFGIGRYLYHLPQVWAAYDPQKRRFTEPPRISIDAVNRALALCGLPPVPAGPQPSRPQPAPRASAPAPESSGDRKAAEVRQRAIAAMEQQPSATGAAEKERVTDLYRQTGRQTGFEPFWGYCSDTLGRRVQKWTDLQPDDYGTLGRALEVEIGAGGPSLALAGEQHAATPRSSGFGTD